MSTAMDSALAGCNRWISPAISLAIAVQASPKTDPGLVASTASMRKAMPASWKKVTGSLPDGLKFSPDGSQLVVANEGELSASFTTDGIDPVGCISIIPVKQGMPADQAVTLDFSDFNAGAGRSSCRRQCALAASAPAWRRTWNRICQHQRRQQPGLCHPAGEQCRVVVNLRQPHIERLLPMGVKDHGLARNALAASDQVEPPFQLKSYNQLFGLQGSA